MGVWLGLLVATIVMGELSVAAVAQSIAPPQSSMDEEALLEQPEERPAVVRPLRRRQVFTSPAITPDTKTQMKLDSLIDEVLLPEATFDLVPNQSKLIRTKLPVSRFSVTDPGMVQIVQFGPTEFELIGQTIGSTTLTLWFGEPDEQQQVLRYLIRVSAEQDLGRAEYGELQDRINELFPESMVQLIPVLDKLIVRGQARDAKEAAEILSILSGNAIDQTGRLQGPGAQFNLGPTGTFPGQFEEGLAADNLISLLEVPGEQQIMLKVRVAELSRSAMREFGSDFIVNRGDFTFASLLGGGQGAVRAVLDTNDVTLALSAISGNSYSKILAEPNLITLNGQPASFVAGGQFAVPTVVGVGGAQAATTSFQSFGTQLSFTPTLVDKDRIRLTVVPTFSSLNQDNAVGGIPGLDTRTVSTTVDLREGQWLAIAGLIQDQQAGSENRVPWLGNMPVADLFFSGRTTSRSETELVILVSPELVHPLEPEEVPLCCLPGMEVTEPNDCDFFLCGRYEGDPDCQHRSTVWPLQQDRIVDAHLKALDDAKATGKYQKSQQFYIHGPVGFSR